MGYLDSILDMLPLSSSFRREFPAVVFGEDFLPYEDLPAILVLMIVWAVTQYFTLSYCFYPIARKLVPKPACLVAQIEARRGGGLKKPLIRPPSPPDETEMAEETAKYEKTLEKFAFAGFKFCAYSLVLAVGVYSLFADDIIESIRAGGAGWMERGIEGLCDDWPDLKMRDIKLFAMDIINVDYLKNVRLFCGPLAEWLFTPSFADSLTADSSSILVNSPIILHYRLATSFYLYSSIMMFFGKDGTPKSDHLPMGTHHAVTLFLFFFSWHWKVYRYGSVIAILHDCADPFMELAKLFLYQSWQLCADCQFALFSFVFVFTRCYLLPRYLIIPLVSYILNTSEGMRKAQLVPGWQLGVMSLGILQLLHFFWGSLIVRMVAAALSNGKIGDDVREEDTERLLKQKQAEQLNLDIKKSK
eukprot:Partr_v1_DN26474_c1_g1_i1_m24164 putative ceramide synthase